MFVWLYKVRCRNPRSMPQVIQMEICPWLFFTFGESAPGVLDIMSCSLLVEDLLLEVSFSLRWFCPLRGCMFIEYPLCGFLCCQTISHMQTMLFKECKAYVCLEMFWKCVFYSKTKFARMWYQLVICSKSYKSQDTFVKVCVVPQNFPSHFSSICSQDILRRQVCSTDTSI